MTICESEEDVFSLIPGLHDDLAYQCLLRLGRSSLKAARAVSKRWRSVVLSNTFYERRTKDLVAEGWLYVRSRDKHFYNTVRAFDPSSEQWQTLPIMPHDNGGKLKIRGLGCATLGGKLYVVGGWPEGGPASKAVYCYDPRTNKWRRKTDMLTGRCYHVCTTVKGVLYVTGGMTRPHLSRDELLSSMEVYDPRLDRWQEGPCMPEPPLFALGVSHKHLLYVTGLLTQEERVGLVFDTLTQAWRWMKRVDIDLVAANFTATDGRLVCLYEKGGQQRLRVWDEQEEDWRQFPPWNQFSVPLRPNKIACLSFICGSLYFIDYSSGVHKVRCGYTSDPKVGGGMRIIEERRISSGVAFPDEQVIDCHVLPL